MTGGSALLSKFFFLRDPALCSAGGCDLSEELLPPWGPAANDGAAPDTVLRMPGNCNRSVVRLEKPLCYLRGGGWQWRETGGWVWLHLLINLIHRSHLRRCWLREIPMSLLLNRSRSVKYVVETHLDIRGGCWSPPAVLIFLANTQPIWIRCLFYFFFCIFCIMSPQICLRLGPLSMVASIQPLIKVRPTTHKKHI